MKTMKIIKTRWKATGILTMVLAIVPVVFVVVFISASLLPVSFNFTPSMPRGLYYSYDCSPVKGDIIQFKPTERTWQFAVDRKYVSDRMEGLLKTVVATSGDRVCWQEDKISINEEFVGEVAVVDAMGRSLGHDPECITVQEGQLLPMALDYNKSFDGRYFGLIIFENVQSCAGSLITY